MLGIDWHEILAKFLNLIYRIPVRVKTETNIQNVIKDMFNLLKYK